jgi:hypothetical protein
MLRALAIVLFAAIGAAHAQDAPRATKPLNTLDTIVNDMKLRNDLPLRGYEHQTVGWYVGPGQNQMGNDPRTSNTPQWWRKAHKELVNDTYLKAMLPWAVIFDGAGHAATNTRVQLRDFRAYYKSRASGEWKSYGTSPGLSGFSTPKSTLFNGTIPENKRTNADGSVEIAPPASSGHAWHGWWDLGRVPIEPTDIAAVFVTLQARLVVDDARKPDDRDKARLLLWTGVDYYLDGKTNWTAPNPGAVASRSKRITSEWQAFNAMTFSDVGAQEPGGGITEAEFRRKPPPLH